MKLPTTWNINKLATGPFDPKFILKRKKILKQYKSFHKKWSNDSSYLTNSSSMKEALDAYEKLASYENIESLYLFLASSLNTEDTEIQAASQLLSDFSNTLSDYVRFFELSIGKIDIQTQKKFLSDPLLSEYRKYLSDIFTTAVYTLSEKEEKILSMKSGVSAGNWVNMLEEFLSSETREITIAKKKEEVSFSQLMNLMRSSEGNISDQAIEGIKSILKNNEKVAEKEINSFLENKKINDQLRGFKRPDASRHIAEDIASKTVDTFVKTVTENFKISQDFYTFKAKLFKVKKFSYFNRIVEYGQHTKKYSYEDSVNIVERALLKISPEFRDIFIDFVNNNQIDVYPSKGKSGGAFCMPSYSSDVHILLNHDGSIRNVTTLAHEVGHGIHATKARKENALNYDVPMCTAEVASTFCEDFVIDELLTDADDEMKLVMMINQLEDKVATIFRQIAAYNFEKELHEEFRKKGYLPGKEIGELFNKHMKSYMGDAVSFDEDSGRGWIYWSHFRSSFYVFAYAMALLVSQYAKKQLTNDPSYLMKINEFYETGSSKSPDMIFKSLGIQVNNDKQWMEGINQVRELLKQTTKLAKKLGKI